MSFLTETISSIIIFVNSTCLNTGRTKPDESVLAFAVSVDKVLVELALPARNTAISLYDISSPAFAGGFVRIGGWVGPTFSTQVATLDIHSVLACANACSIIAVGVGAFRTLSAHTVVSCVSSDALTSIISPYLVAWAYAGASVV